MCWWYIVRQLPAHCTHSFRATSALYCFSSCYYEKFCEDVEIHLPTLAYLYLTLLNSSFKNIRFDFTIKSLAVLFLSLVLCVRDPWSMKFLLNVLTVVIGDPSIFSPGKYTKREIFHLTDCSQGSNTPEVTAFRERKIPLGQVRKHGSNLNGKQQVVILEVY